MAEGPALSIEGLSVEAGSRCLLHDARLQVEAGEIVLLAGPSGSGKSVLLRILAGLIRPDSPGFRLTGSARVLGRDVIRESGSSRGKVGLVFQDYALFTGLSADSNVGFALDHREGGRNGESPDDFLTPLGIPGEARVSRLSGGQRQRVAIARALAYRPAILAYDEPTSGLDPRMSEEVGKLIRETRDRHGTTTVVVTHDLAGLLKVADRVVIFDPEARSLEEVSKDAALERLAELAVPATPSEDPPSGVSRMARSAVDFLEGTGRVLTGLGTAARHLIPQWRSPRWGIRFLGHYLKTVAGPGALLYFLLAGVVMGLVSTYFVFTFLPKPEYTKPLILDDLVGGIGFGLHRILVPLILTILLAARAGAAVAADVATRVAGQQTDAMRSLNAPAARYLLTGTLWAFLIGAPVAALFAYVGARAASAGVFAAMAPDVSLHAWSEMFHRLFDTPGRLLPEGTGWVIGKVLTAAAGTAAIAYFQGIRPKESPEDVARSITATVIWATVLVLAVQVVFALVEF